jgi:hypothetical protein
VEFGASFMGGGVEMGEFFWDVLLNHEKLLFLFEIFWDLVLYWGKKLIMEQIR